jgi:hypothetical protein
MCPCLHNDSNANPVFLFITKLKLRICSWGKSRLPVLQTSFTLNVISFSCLFMCTNWPWTWRHLYDVLKMGRLCEFYNKMGTAPTLRAVSMSMTHARELANNHLHVLLRHWSMSYWNLVFLTIKHFFKRGLVKFLCTLMLPSRCNHLFLLFFLHNVFRP